MPIYFQLYNKWNKCDELNNCDELNEQINAMSAIGGCSMQLLSTSNNTTAIQTGLYVKNDTIMINNNIFMSSNNGLGCIMIH